jgi:rhodanese-related sulfurtransferase
MNTLTSDELKRMLDEKESFYLINVLSPNDFREAHIPGSHNIPLADKNFVREVERLVGDKDATIVVYCSGFDCSASPTAAKKLSQRGFSRVLDFEGGIEAWHKAGYPFAQGAQRQRG